MVSSSKTRKGDIMCDWAKGRGWTSEPFRTPDNYLLTADTVSPAPKDEKPRVEKEKPEIHKHCEVRDWFVLVK